MKLRILNNIALRPGRFLLELAAPAALAKANPGQFLHVRIEDSCDPLLRRPLSIHDTVFAGPKKGGVVRIIYEVAGKGTALLSQKKPLAELDVLGPLGQGFDLAQLKKSREIIIVAGGMGVAPLYFLAKQLVSTSRGSRVPAKIVVLLGAKTKSHLLCEKEFKKLDCEALVATEDGSKGFKGRVTELLKEFLAPVAAGAPRGGESRPPVICACGPKAMLAAISEISGRSGCRAYVSLEEFMGCGLGACLGCAIRTTSGYKRTCHDGPVFDASQVIWRG